jgi:hypothetical protein
MSSMAVDQKKKYLCILSKDHFLKCFKVNNIMKNSFLFKKIHFKDNLTCLQIKSFKKMVNVKNLKKYTYIDSLYIGLIVNENLIKIFDISNKKIIIIDINSKIKSISLSKSEIYIFSKNFIYIFDIKSGELIKKLKFGTNFNFLYTKKKNFIEICKKSKYLIVLLEFLVVIYIKFDSIIKIFKDNNTNIKSLHIINPRLVILLMNDNLLKKWSTKKKSYNNFFKFFLEKKKLKINKIKKIYINNFLLLIFLCENTLTFSTLIGFVDFNKRLKNPLLIDLFEKVKFFEILKIKNELIIVCKFLKKIIPFKVYFINFEMYLNLPNLKEIKERLETDINYFKFNKKLKDYTNCIETKKNFLKKILEKKNKYKNKIKFIDIVYKSNQNNLKKLTISKKIIENLTIFITKYKNSNLFFKQMIYKNKINRIKSFQHLNKGLIEFLLLFFLKKISQEKLNIHLYLLWVKEVVLFYFSYLSQNIYIQNYLNKIFFETSNSIDFKILQNLFINVRILNIQYKKFTKSTNFYKNKINLVNFCQIPLEKI